MAMTPPVPILAKGKTVTGRIWTYVRDDRPFGGHAPPAALYYASRDRKHEHPVQPHRSRAVLCFRSRASTHARPCTTALIGVDDEGHRHQTVTRGLITHAG